MQESDFAHIGRDVPAFVMEGLVGCGPDETGGADGGDAEAFCDN